MLETFLNDSAYSLANMDTGGYFWSSAFYDYLGYDQEDVAPTVEGFFAKVHPEDINKVEQAFQRFQDQQEFKNPLVCRLMDAKGSFRNSIVHTEYGHNSMGELVVVTRLYDEERLGKDIAFYQDALDLIRQDDPYSVSFDIERDTRVVNKVRLFANLGWWEHSKVRNELSVSSGIKELFELEHIEDIAPEDFYQKMPEEDRRKMEQAIADQASCFDDNLRVQLNSGKIRWINMKVEFTWHGDQLIKSFGLVQDVTKQMEMEQHLVRVQELAKVGWYEIDYHNLADSRASREFMRIHNYATDDPNNEPDLGKFAEKVHPDDREKLRIFEQIDNPSFTQWSDLEYRVRDCEGNLKYIQGYGEILRNHQGEPVKAIGVTLDVTKLKLAEHHLERVQELSKIGWYETDLVNPEKSRFSRQYLKIHGFMSDDSSSASNYQQYVHPEDQHLMEPFNHLDDTSFNEWSYLRYRLITPSGDTIHLESHGEVLRSPSGEPIGLLGVVQNQTESVKLEMRLSEAQRQAKIGWYELDLLNPAKNTYSTEYLRLHGYPDLKSFADREKFLSLVHPEDLADVAQALKTQMERASDLKIEYRAKNDEGEYRNLLTVARFVAAERGKSRKLIGTVQDITELKETEEKLQLAQQISHTGWFEYYPEQPARSRFSKEWLRMFDYEEGELPSERNYIQRVHPKERAQIPNVKTFLTQMPPEWDQLEFRIITRKGEIRYISNSTRVAYANGIPVKAFGVTTDVTDVRRAQKDLWKSERMYRLLSETSREVIILLHGEPGATHITYASYSALQVFGYHSEELIGKTSLELMHPGDVQDYLKFFKNQLKNLGDKAIKMTYRLQKKSGEYFWAEILANAFSDGREDYFRLSIRDISDRKAVENELIRTNNDLKAMIRATENLVFIINKDMVFDAVIAPDETKLQTALAEYLNRPVEEIWTDENSKKVIDLVAKSFKDHQSRSIEYPGTFKGKNDWFRAHSHYYQGYNGEDMACVVVETITLQKLAQEELERGIEMERELSQMRANFVSMASHQFRTPLTVIKSNMQLLEAAQVRHPIIPKVQKRLIREVDRLVMLMEDILILGKVQSSNLKSTEREVDLTLLLEDVITDTNESQADGRQLLLQVRGEPVTFRGDSSLLRHAILNIVNNAFKYSQNKPAPKACLDFTPKDHSLLLVEDFGLGISKDDQQKILKDFYRGENAQSIAGTGLGLSVTREFLKLNGCTLHISSELNKGSVFKIKFPRKK